MGESLIERRRVREEGLRVVNRFSHRKMAGDFGNRIQRKKEVVMESLDEIWKGECSNIVESTPQNIKLESKNIRAAVKKALSFFAIHP